MASEVEIIRRLHRILRQQADIRSQLERGPRTIRAAHANLANVTKEVTDHKELIKQKRMDADRKQLQLRGRESKIFELEGKMNISKKQSRIPTAKGADCC